MRTTLCTLVFLFALPWSLNGYLSTSQKNTVVTNSEEVGSEQSGYTNVSKVKNVVSLSKHVQTSHLTSNTEGPSENSNQVSKSFSKAFTHRAHLNMENGEKKTADQRTKTNIVSTIVTKPKRQSEQTQQKDQGSSHSLRTTSVLQSEITSEFNIATKTPNATRADLLPKKNTQDFTSLSEQQSIHTERRIMTSKDQTSNQRTVRSTKDGDHNTTSSVEQPETETIVKILTTLQKEQEKPTDPHKPHATSNNSSELKVSTKPPGATSAEEISRGLETLDTSQVSLSISFQTKDFTSHSEQRDISLRTTNSEETTSNQRIKRNTDEIKHNFTMVQETTTQEEVTTQKELNKPTESSHKPQTSAPWIETSSEFNISTKTPSMTMTNETKTSVGYSTIQATTQKIPSTSIGHYSSQATVMEGNTNGELNTTLPTMKTTDQPSPMTHIHTSSAIKATTNFNKTVRTNGVPTTESEDVRRPITHGPEIRTSTRTTSTKKTTTTKEANKINPPEKVKSNPGPAVAAVICTTFFLMFIAIIFILVRKRKMQKRQLENPEWAGPSPFLDGEVQPNLTNMDEPEGINRQGFSQLSIARYLPNRLSKHLTLGSNTSDEVLMGDIMQGSTFGRQNADEVQAPNGNTKVSQEPTESEQNKSQEEQKPVNSSNNKTNESESTQEPVMKNKESKQTDDVIASLPSDTDTKIKHPTPLVSIDLDSLSEEAAPFQTSDGGVTPPAPPLP